MPHPFSRRRLRQLSFLVALVVGFGVATAADAPPPLPPLQAETPAGERLTPGAQTGAVSVIVLWSPDSLASRKSIGELQRFDDAFRARGVRTLAISTLRDGERLRAYAAEHQLHFPLLILGEHQLGPLPEQNLPIVYVLDRNGGVRAAHAGLFRLRDLEREVEALLAP